MFDVMRFSGRATYLSVVVAVRCSPIRRLALAFPLGADTRFASSERMESLAALAWDHGKTLTIVGGSELLRAHAVAAGLCAAMTLDDWRAKPHATSSAPARVTPRQTGASARPRLTLVPNATPRPASAQDAAESLWDDEPPAHIREVLARHGRIASRPAAVSQPGAYEIGYSSAHDDADAMRLILWSERYEERMTSRIRATGGLAMAANQYLAEDSSPGDTNDGDSH